MSGDQHIEAQAMPPAANQAADHSKLLDDSSFNKYVTRASNNTSDSNALTGINSTAVGRSLYALGEGATLSFHSAWNYAGDLTHNPTKLAEQAGIGLAFGIGLRVLLPEAGAARALVGTLMTVGMAKDALTPIARTIGLASSATNMEQVHQAAQVTGDGLGQFMVNTAVAMVPGMIGEKGAGALLKSTATGRFWESWKTSTFNSDDTATGRFFTGSARFADRTAESVAVSADALKARLTGQDPPRVTPLGIDEKLARIKKLQVGIADQAADLPPADAAGVRPQDLRGEKFDLPKLTASGARFRNLPNEVDGLLGNATYLAEGHPDYVPRSGLDFEPLRGQKRMLSPDGQDPGANTATGTNAGDAQPGTNGGAKDTTGGGTNNQVPPAGGDTAVPIKKTETAKPTDTTTTAGAKTDVDKEADALRQMAIATRTRVGKVSKEDIAVAQVKEDFQGPLTSTMRSGPAPLDADHFTNNEMLIALARQLRNAGDVRQAGMLLDHYRTANQQLELAKSKDPGALTAITDMNLATRSIHADLIARMRAIGIDPNEVLRSTNSPLFTIRDSGGAGNYTIPAIDGVTDAAVIAYAREYQEMEGVIFSGVDIHESGHNYAYRDMLRLPAELRDKILTEDVVKNALKQKGIDVNQEIEVPGAPDGKMKLVDFLVTMLKAQANENTADIYAMCIDPNTGRALINLLASLRKPSPTDMTGPGLLETRSVYGKDMIDEEMGNNIGIEPHAIDRFRIKMAAQIMREGANGNAKMIKEADTLDKLADKMSRPGSMYVWANADEPGKFVAIPQAAVDALIPLLVKAQLDTPLDALKGHTWREIMPDLSYVYDKVDTLSSEIAAAAINGKSTIPTFDKSQYRIEQVFSAGLSGWDKALQQNAANGGKLTPDQVLTRILKISESLRSQYRGDVPETQTPSTPLIKMTDVALKPMSFVLSATSRLARAQTGMRNFFDKYAVPIGAATAAQYLTSPLDALRRDAMNQQQIKDRMNR